MNQIFFRLSHRLLLLGLVCRLLTGSCFGATTTVTPWGWDTLGQTAVPEGLTNVVALAAGEDSALALRDDGTLAFWGANTYGQSTPPAGLSNVVAIDVGGDFSLALKRDGTVAVWGDNYYQQTNMPAGLSNIMAVAAGTYHALALRQDGTVVGWGLNDSGQTNVPAGLSNVVAISAGYKHSLALKKDGTVAAWGSNSDYQGGPANQATVPAGISNIVAISAGGYHNLLLKADGTVLAWGHNAGPVVNYSGQSVVPAGLSNVVAVAAGEYHSLALKADGTMVEWGDHIYWPAGMPAGLSNVVGIAAGTFYSLALGYTAGPALILRPPADQATIVGVPVGLSVCAVGPEPLTYQWQCAGTNLPGATSSSLSWSNPQVSDSGTYNVVVSNPYGSISSSNVQVTVSASAPVILAQPADQAVLAGSNVLLSVSAAGTAAMQYQWRHEGTNLAGATEARLSLADAQPSQTGLYEVLVSNALGCLTSRPATLLVYAPPVIDQQPSNRTAIVGTPTTFAVSAQSLPPVRFQWRFNGADIGGATNATLVLSGLQFEHAGAYQVLISNPLSATLSEPGVLTVIDGPPVILTGPVPQEAYPGGPAAFQVAAGGTLPQEYQWRFNGTDIPGATNATLAIAQVGAGDAGLYSVVVRNAFGSTTSSAAALVVGPVMAWGDNSSGQTNLPAGLTNAIAIATGYGHNLALKSDGTVLAWGYNAYKQCNVPAGLSNVLAVAAGGGSSFALKSDGTVTGWGMPPAPVPAGLTNVVQIAAGTRHMLALKGDGTVIGWGMNDLQQISIPTDLSNVIAVAAGSTHSLALTSDGRVVAWGSSVAGANKVPADVSNVVAIAAGVNDSLALKSDGTVVAWGNNTSGEATVPAGLSNVVAIAAGEHHNLALRSDGSVVGWGSNSRGQISIPPALGSVIGIGAGTAHSLAIYHQGPPRFLKQPVSQTNYSGSLAELCAPAVGPGPMSYQWQFNGQAIPGATNAWLSLSNVQPADAGSYFVTATSPLGSTASSNLTLSVPVSAPVMTAQPISQVGFLGPKTSNITFRVSVLGSWPLSYQWQFNGMDLAGASGPVLTLTNAQLAQAGLYRVVVSNALGVVTSEAARLSIVPVVGWGVGNRGQTNVPASAADAVAIAAGNYHGLALRSDGTVVGWGYNGSGQTNVPPAATNVVAIAGGSGHSLALRADGTVLAWGNNGSGQANVPPTATNVTAIVAGAYHSLALRADGTVVAWGLYGQAAVSAAATNVVAIAAGSSHSLALRNDGTIVGWGQNSYGQITIPSKATNVVAIAAGDSQSLALRADGTVVTWGYSNYGLDTIPSNATNVVAIAASSAHDVALRADGSVVVWGDGMLGQRAIPAGTTNVVAIEAGQDYSLALLGDGRPRILTQPWNRTASIGTNLVLGVPAVGQYPMSYQWQRNGTNIPGATRAAYVLDPLDPASGGDYALTISNALGKVTSAAAHVNLAPIATNITVATLQSRPLTIPVEKILGFVTEPEGDALTLSSVSATTPLGAKIKFSGDGVTYTPAATFAGLDRFSYWVSDGHGGSASAYIYVKVYRPSEVAGNLQSPTATAGGFQVSFGGAAGQTYIIQRAESVAGPWVSLDSFTLGTNGVGTWADTNAPAGSAYYRTVYP